MQALTQFWRDRRGISAIEFSLVAPVLATVLVLGWDTWSMISQSNDMRTAVQTGARYYQEGGSNDTDAQTAALAAWTRKPSDGTLSVARACTCDSTPADCSATCAGAPMTYITLTANSTFNGSIQHRALTEKEVIRVR